MNDDRLISIVTPSYNQAEFIEENVLSVISQDYMNVEHIIVDGGSTDGTLKILERYKDRLVIISEKDGGQSDAINKGFNLAKGDVIGWLNSDDTYKPNIFRKVVNYFSEHKDIDMLYGNCDIIRKDGSFLRKFGQLRSSKYDYRKLLIGGVSRIPQPSVFLKAGIFQAVGGLDISLRHAMDYDLWLRIGARFNIASIPDVLSNFRLYKESKTGSEFLIQHKESLSVRARYHKPSIFDLFFYVTSEIRFYLGIAKLKLLNRHQ